MVPSETACTSVSKQRKLQGSGSLPILLWVPPPPKAAARYILLQSLGYTGPLRDNDFLLLFFPLHLNQSSQIGKGKWLLEAGESHKCSGGSSKCLCPRVPAHARPLLLEWDSKAPHFLILSASLHCHRLASAELCPLEGSTLLLGKSKSRSEISHRIVSLGIQGRGRVRGEPVGGKGEEVGRCEGGGGRQKGRCTGSDRLTHFILFN